MPEENLFIDKIQVNAQTAYNIHDQRIKDGYALNSKNLGVDYVDTDVTPSVTYPSTAGMLAFCWSAVSNSGLRYTFTLSDGESSASYARDEDYETMNDALYECEDIFSEICNIADY